MRRLALIVAGVCLLCGCMTRERTVVPATEGFVFDGLSGAPLAGAAVTATEGGGGTVTHEGGRFSLAATTERSTEIVLPASGVYVARAPLKAETAHARAYGWASYLSIGDTADQPVVLFLLPDDLPAGEALPANCTPPDEAVYALQLMQADLSGAFHAWHRENPDNAVYLDELLSSYLLGSLYRQCAMPVSWHMDMKARIRAFAGTD